MYLLCSLYLIALSQPIVLIAPAIFSSEHFSNWEFGFPIVVLVFNNSIKISDSMYHLWSLSIIYNRPGIFSYSSPACSLYSGLIQRCHSLSCQAPCDLQASAPSPLSSSSMSRCYTRLVCDSLHKPDLRSVFPDHLTLSPSETKKNKTKQELL